MSRLKLIGLTGITATFVLFLLTASLDNAPTPPSTRHLHSRLYPPDYNDYDSAPRHHHTPIDASTVRDILAEQFELIARETSDYRFPDNTTLESHLPAADGRPLQNIIITTWRSGSTFLGEVLNAVPGTFYHYEPLLDYGIVQIRGEPYARSALANLGRLLRCNYQDMRNYLEYGESHVYLFTHNTRLWSVCQTYPGVCWDAGFLSKFCRLFPFQSMKVVRLRLRLAEKLLKDESLNVKIVLLVRDPRGILQSRKHRAWCPGIPDCDQANLLCDDMLADYKTAIRLRKKYPGRFRAIRYEDLSVNPYENVRELFDFFGMHFHPQVEAFLDTHTKLNVGGVSSTFRDSKSAPFHWRLDLNFTEVQNIEDNCGDAMRAWGYRRAYNETSMRDFDPLDAMPRVVV